MGGDIGHLVAKPAVTQVNNVGDGDKNKEEDRFILHCYKCFMNMFPLILKVNRTHASGLLVIPILQMRSKKLSQGHSVQKSRSQASLVGVRTTSCPASRIVVFSRFPHQAVPPGTRTLFLLFPPIPLVCLEYSTWMEYSKNLITAKEK